MDIRQNSKVHEAVVAELLATAGVTSAYLVLPEEERVALLTRELTSPRPLSSPHLAYSDRTQSELGVVRAIAGLHARFGPRVVPHYIISNCNSLSDLLEVAVLLKEAGLVRVTPKAGGSASAPGSSGSGGGKQAGEAAKPLFSRVATVGSALPVTLSSSLDIIPLFETIKDLMAGGESSFLSATGGGRGAVEGVGHSGFVPHGCAVTLHCCPSPPCACPILICNPQATRWTLPSRRPCLRRWCAPGAACRR
jgi:hypothetical protein